MSESGCLRLADQCVPRPATAASSCRMFAARDCWPISLLPKPSLYSINNPRLLVMPVVFGEPQLIAQPRRLCLPLLYSLTTHSQDSGIQRTEDEAKHLLETPSGWKMHFDSQFQKVQFSRPKWGQSHSAHSKDHAPGGGCSRRGEYQSRRVPSGRKEGSLAFKDDSQCDLLLSLWSHLPKVLWPLKIALLVRTKPVKT